MNKLFHLIICASLLAASGGAQAFGINDILVPVFRLGVKATGNAVSNLVDSVADKATGKRSREAVQADKKAFLENAYDRLEKSCVQFERARLDPAKAVMTDVYEEAFAGEFDGTVSRPRRALLTLEDVGEAALSAPSVTMATAELQAKAYRAGVGTIGGRSKWDTERIMDAAEAAARNRQVIPVQPSMAAGATTTPTAGGIAQAELPGYFRDPILREPCVKEQMSVYLAEVRTRSEGRLTKSAPADAPVTGPAQQAQAESGASAGADAQ